VLVGHAVVELNDALEVFALQQEQARACDRDVIVVGIAAGS
jgi:hypothetical protein